MREAGGGSEGSGVCVDLPILPSERNLLLDLQNKEDRKIKTVVQQRIWAERMHYLHLAGVKKGFG